MDIGIFKSPRQDLTSKQVKDLEKLVEDIGIKEALKVTEEKRNAANSSVIDNEKKYLIWWAGTPVISNPCSGDSYISWEY